MEKQGARSKKQGARREKGEWGFRLRDLGELHYLRVEIGSILVVNGPGDGEICEKNSADNGQRNSLKLKGFKNMVAPALPPRDHMVVTPLPRCDHKVAAAKEGSIPRLNGAGHHSAKAAEPEGPAAAVAILGRGRKAPPPIYFAPETMIWTTLGRPGCWCRPGP
jgi:hypothetical protein